MVRRDNNLPMLDRALERDFGGAFSDVVFAIADWSAERRFLGRFRELFA